MGRLLTCRMQALRGRAIVGAFAFAFVHVAVSQPYWVKDVGGLGADHVADVRTDGQGNIYVAGEFANSFTYDGTTLTSSGATDGFVAKLDPLGALQWMVRCGGPGTDRAIKLEVSGGSVVVTGQFTGTADLFGSALTSAGGTVDVFVAKLNGANGSLQWVRQGGSDVWAERPYGITVTPNGHVTVAGEFKGSATFSAQTITSLIDPLTQQYGFDVFIASYDGTGNLLWLQQGAASHVDRAIDVVGDAGNNLYVCGQYSDTITFDVQHPGNAFNATFLVKFDAAGQEQWFRRCGGAQFGHVRDMQLSDAGTLVLCGDLQGTMLFEDGSPDPIAAGAPYAVYLLDVDASGELLTAQVQGSDEPLGVDGLVQQGGGVALFGQFTCGFGSLQAQYGTGVFMALGDQDLFIARYTFPGLQFQDAQQFGGRGGKQAGRIAALPGGALVFCGSYADDLVVPTDGGNWGEEPFGSGNGSFCGDPDYGAFTQNTSMGLFDGFVARAYVNGRQPYDFWSRSGACQRPMLDICLYRWQYAPPCPGQLDVCEPIVLALTTPFDWVDPYMPPQASAGPMMDILWSDGSTGPYMSVLTSGWYWCTMTSANGCWSVTDSVYVNMSTPPDATVSDALGVNYASNYPQPLYLCDTTAWLWCPTVQPGDVVTWSAAGLGTVQNDSILATVDGLYTVVVTGTNGCSDEAQVYVAVTPSDPLPNITDVEITLYDPWGGILDGDTIAGCPYSGVLGPAEVQFWIDSLPGTIPGNVQMAVNSGGMPGGTFVGPNDPLYWGVPTFQGTGWYHFTFTINIFDTPCESDTLTFLMPDSIYWVDVQQPAATFPDSVLLCPGGTSYIAVDCPDCDQVIWQGPGLVSTTASGDTAWIDAYGYYQLSLMASEPWGSCIFNEFVVASAPTVPPLISLPPDGLICPGDSAVLCTTAGGIFYQWEGPDGLLGVNNDSVVVSELGDYYLQLTDVGGCVLGAGPISIAGLGTPFVSIPGDSTLCPGESLVVEIVATGATSIAWQAPLQGSSPVQVIDQPGLYTCVVTSCGVPFLVSVPIGMSTPLATITADPDPPVTCNGSPVVLQGPPGMADYIWSPGPANGPTYAVDQQGYYVLVVTDPYGCMDTSAYFFVAADTIAQPLTAQGDTVCEGATAVLGASGSGTISWYADAGANIVLGSGTVLTTPPCTADAVFYVQQVDGPCVGAVLPVVVEVTPSPEAPVLSGDVQLCAGASGVLAAEGEDGAVFTWTTPGGTIVEADTLPLGAPVEEGSYLCIAEVAGCPGGSAAIDVVVEDCGLVIPNVFSPNGDGRNDAFVLESPDGAPIEVEILNRWGQEVFAQRAATIRWNGLARSGERVSDGVYYYIIRIQAQEGMRVYTGHLQVLR